MIRFKKYLILSLCFAVLGFADVSAAVTPVQDQDLFEKIKKEIRDFYPGTRVTLLGDLSRFSKKSGLKANQLRSVQDLGRGVAILRFVQGDQWLEKKVEFSAHIQTWVAKKRIMPRTPLKRSDFDIRNVDISRGVARRYRGALLSKEVQIERYETTQSILAGYFPLINGVRKIPDVRRGDPVVVRIKAGQLVLTTPGVARQEGYQTRKVNVTSTPSNKNLTGLLQPGNVVEVSL